MKKDVRFAIMGSALVLALCMSALASIPAFADDATPPPDSSPTQVVSDGSATGATSPTTVTATDAPTQVAPTDATTTDAPPTEVAPTEAATEVAPTAAPTDTATTVASPTTEPGTAPSSTTSGSGTSDVLTQIPAGTTVVAVDSTTGQSVPLASQAAADIVATGDPMWCPNGINPGGAGCSPSFGSMGGSGLIAWLIANPKSVAGTIWIQSGVITESGPVVLDGGTLTTMKNLALTVKGGWNGVLGAGTTSAATPSTFNVPFTITGWVGDVTISDLQVNGASSTGLTVSTKGKISLTRVRTQNNSGAGASLDNCVWVSTACTGTGTVTIASSVFTGNGTGGAADGLDVLSKGAITLTSVVASGNSGIGASLNNVNAAPTLPQAVTLNGLNLWDGSIAWSGTSGSFDNSFSSNGTDGLDVTTLGLITISNLTASSNGTGGVSGSGAVLVNTGGTAGVTMTGFNALNANYGSGLVINTRGAVALNSLMANSNANGDGADIENNVVTVPQNVTLTGTNVFKYNGVTGLYILSKGLVTLNAVTANGSDGLGSSTGTGWGAYIDNTFSGNLSTQLRNVVLNGVNTFSDNALGGLKIASYGTLTLSNITANNNGGYGLELPTQNDAKVVQNVNLTGNNTFNYNALTGLKISSFGTITLNNVTANNNGGFGAQLHNDVGGTYIINTTAPIVLNGVNVFLNNYSTGLEVVSHGAITTTSVTANGNVTGGSLSDYGGAYLYNRGSSLLTPPGITLNGTNVFNDNFVNGLVAQSNGAITLANVTAVGNQNKYGVTLSNSAGTASAGSPGITLSGVARFTDNFASGLDVSSYGTISLSLISLVADNNGTGSNDLLGGWGVHLDNSSASVAKNVSLTGTGLYTDNYSGGLFINSTGAVSASNLTATGNGPAVDHEGFGVWINNRALPATSTSPGVTISGTNVFSNNFLSGLKVLSYGPVSLSTITASANNPGATYGEGYGVYVDNTGSPSPTSSLPGVTLSGISSFTNNYLSGLVVTTNGAVTLSSITATGNGTGNDNVYGGWGAIVQNAGSTTVQKTVTLGGNNVFSNNYSGGLSIDATGAISINSVTANGNGSSSATIGYGVYLNNRLLTASATSPAVTVSGVNSFNNNYLAGLYLTSYGAINLSSITATNNGMTGGGGWGAYVTNVGPTVAKNVNLAGTNVFSNNFSGGLSVSATGSITTNAVTANGNQGTGLLLDTRFLAPATGSLGVTMYGVNVFNSNYSTGLQVNSYGAVSLSTITANANGVATSSGWGAYVDNSGASVAKTVTLAGTNNFNDNYSGGLTVLSTGAITTSNLTANDTHGDGAVLKNVGTVASGGVTLNGTNVFHGNASDGLIVWSKGLITVSNVTATDNVYYDSGSHTYSGGYGAWLMNTPGVTTSLAPGVNLSGVNVFNDNYLTGLLVQSNGTINITSTSMTANGNAQTGSANGWGVILDNSSAGTGVALNVTVGGLNTFNGNYDGGLDVLSKGIVTLNSVTASNNTNGNGAVVNNTMSGAKSGVTINGTNVFNNNGPAAAGIGLLVTSNGSILTNNLTANYNAAGIILDNCSFNGTFCTGGTAAQTITLNGVNTFTENSGNGARITSAGNLNLNKISADGNTADGLYAYTSATMTVTCGTFTNNGANGIEWSPTSAILKAVYSYGNGGQDIVGTINPTVNVRVCPLP